MLGYGEQREVLLWVQTDGPARVHLSYTDSLGRTEYTDTVRTKKETAFTAKLIADRVRPGHPYTYRVHLDGRPLALPYPTTFRAQPTWRWRRDPPDFTVALGSCNYVNDPPYDRPGAGYGGDYGIFRRIDSLHPDLMVWLGDNTYLREPDWYTRTGYFHRYSHTRALPELQPLLARTHHYATWDDHDYGPNNSDRSWVHRELAKEAFDLFWGNLTSGLPGHGGITTAFRYLDTDFFLLDNRSFRTPNDQRAGEERILLGRAQLDWLIENLVASDSPWKLVCVGGQVLNTVRRFETYANLAPEELAYLLRRIDEEKIRGVVFLTGDRHHSELSRLRLPGGRTVYDLTVSPLTAGSGGNRTEVNDNRVKGTLLSERSFGLLHFRGPREARRLRITLHRNDGTVAWEREIVDQ